MLWAWSAFLFSGCSGSEQPEVAQTPIISVFASQAAAGDGGEAGDRRSPGEDDVDPVVESVRFEPAQPASRGRLRAVAKISGRWTSAEYEWDVNGQRFGSNTAQVVLPVIATGDTVSVRVVPVRGVQRGEEWLASVRIRNQSPILLGLGIEPAEAEKAGSSDTEMWRAVVRAEDPDGDSLEIDLTEAEEVDSSDTEMWRAAIRAEDPDGDPLEFEYRWSENDDLLAGICGSLLYERDLRRSKALFDQRG